MGAALWLRMVYNVPFSNNMLLELPRGANRRWLLLNGSALLREVIQSARSMDGISAAAASMQLLIIHSC
jgi:hypothetical protein